MRILRMLITMPIYTRAGDDGSTSLYGGKRVSKACVQVQSYGALDELTTLLGMLICHIKNAEDIRLLEEIQHDLYTMMGFLANAPTDLQNLQERVTFFEKKIDALTQKLPPLNNFIIPGGSVASCWAHIARVCCRKAERIVIKHFEKVETKKMDDKQNILIYLNRLSDLLFTYARHFNEENEKLSKKI